MKRKTSRKKNNLLILGILFFLSLTILVSAYVVSKNRTAVKSQAATSDCQDIYEPNNTISSAKPVRSGQPIVAKLCQNDRDDYYFNITSPGKVSVNLIIPTTLVNNVDWWILKAESNQVICGKGGFSGASSNETCTLSAAGKYIIDIYDVNAKTNYDNVNRYSLRVSSVQPTPTLSR